ncbi:MAG: BRCT domain-containing protein [Terriglobales bacterium]
MKVAITGTLSIPRSDAIQLIESRTNAKFSPHVTHDTNYLVAARFDTNKARRAAEIGVTVISEHDMMEFVEQGAFPANKLPERPKHPHVSHFPDITWTETYEPERIVLLEYQDAEGVVSQRYVALSCKGIGSNGVEYIGGYDAETFKTFRVERIIRMEQIKRAAAMGA